MRTVFFSFLVIVCGTAAGESGFDEYVIDAGFRVEQPPQVADLLGDGDRQLVIAGRDDGHVQYLAIYSLAALQGSRNDPLRTLVPEPKLIGYDIGGIGERDALFFVEPGRIVRYDFATASFVDPIPIQSIYSQNRSGDIMPIDFFRDINDDGRDDLVIPDTAGYRVRLQRADGSLGEESLLRGSSRMTIANNMVRFESRPLFSGDMNFDGLTDLGVWRGNTLYVYAQQLSETFQDEGERMALGLGLLSEQELRALDDGAGSVDQRGLSLKNIVSIEDLNGDALPDIIVESTMSMGVFDKRSDLGLHLGRREGGQLTYIETPDALLKSEGLQYGMVTTDIDGDGLQDLAVRNVRLSFGRVIRALLSGSVSLRLNFYRMTETGGFDEEPSYEAKTSVRFSMGSGQIDVPAIEVADFDGDGIEDLMMQTDTDELGLSRGIPGNDLFARSSTRFDVDLPRNGGLVTSGDINDDGRADLIMRYNAADGVDAQQTVRLFISQQEDSTQD